MVVLRKRVRGLTEQSLNRFLLRARRAVGLSGVVNVLVTSNRELRALNSRFREKEEPTDVLSFPAGQGLLRNFAGDIAISGEMAARNAMMMGHSLGEEIRILTLHGVLHLRGYDHERDNGRMARREQELRRRFGLPMGLIERTSGSKGRG